MSVSDNFRDEPNEFASAVTYSLSSLNPLHVLNIIKETILRNDHPLTQFKKKPFNKLWKSYQKIQPIYKAFIYLKNSGNNNNKHTISYKQEVTEKFSILQLQLFQLTSAEQSANHSIKDNKHIMTSYKNINHCKDGHKSKLTIANDDSLYTNDKAHQSLSFFSMQEESCHTQQLPKIKTSKDFECDSIQSHYFLPAVRHGMSEEDTVVDNTLELKLNDSNNMSVPITADLFPKIPPLSLSKVLHPTHSNTTCPSIDSYKHSINRKKCYTIHPQIIQSKNLTDSTAAFSKSQLFSNVIHSRIKKSSGSQNSASEEPYRHSPLSGLNSALPDSHTGCCHRCHVNCNVWELCQPVRCIIDQNEVEILPAGSCTLSNQYREHRHRRKHSTRKRSSVQRRIHEI